MPSPFPGMDPYLEARHVWPDLHHRLGTVLSEDLNRLLPAPYYAQLEMRAELGIAADEDEPGRPAPRAFVPDVQVARRPGPDAGGGVAVAERVRRGLSPGVELEGIAPEALARHFFVEVRDPARGHKVVTLVEILSPSNKRPGPDRDRYAERQRQALAADVSLVEIDLHRAGTRVTPNPAVAEALEALDPSPYVVLISRAWRRAGPRYGYVAYPFGLREPLPCIPIPLGRDDAEVPLDLQLALDRAYDGGPYRRSVDYAAEPRPPLDPEDASWALALLRAQGLVPSASAPGPG